MLCEYKCIKCEKITEKLVKIGTERIVCPICGGTALKILSVPNFVVHGYCAKNSYSSQNTKQSSASTSSSKQPQ